MSSQPTGAPMFVLEQNSDFFGKIGPNPQQYPLRAQYIIFLTLKLGM
jgi:hypothetical protein